MQGHFQILASHKRQKKQTNKCCFSKIKEERTEYLELDPYQSGSSAELESSNKNVKICLATGQSSKEYIRNKDELGVCEILQYLMLAEFERSFRLNQINGELLTDLSRDNLTEDLELSRFQAMKLDSYIHGWRPNESSTECIENGGESFNPDKWSCEQVYDYMKSLNLDTFAEFCKGNQVDGELLKSILDEDILQDLKNSHDIQLNKLDRKKSYNFVMKGWRPDKIKAWESVKKFDR